MAFNNNTILKQLTALLAKYEKLEERVNNVDVDTDDWQSGCIKFGSIPDCYIRDPKEHPNDLKSVKMLLKTIKRILDKAIKDVEAREGSAKGASLNAPAAEVKKTMNALLSLAVKESKAGTNQDCNRLNEEIMRQFREDFFGVHMSYNELTGKANESNRAVNEKWKGRPSAKAATKEEQVAQQFQENNNLPPERYNNQQNNVSPAKQVSMVNVPIHQDNGYLGLVEVPEGASLKDLQNTIKVKFGYDIDIQSIINTDGAQIWQSGNTEKKFAVKKEMFVRSRGGSLDLQGQAAIHIIAKNSALSIGAEQVPGNDLFKKNQLSLNAMNTVPSSLQQPPDDNSGEHKIDYSSHIAYPINDEDEDEHEHEHEHIAGLQDDIAGDVQDHNKVMEYLLSCSKRNPLRWIGELFQWLGQKIDALQKQTDENTENIANIQEQSNKQAERIQKLQEQMAKMSSQSPPPKIVGTGTGGDFSQHHQDAQLQRSPDSSEQSKNKFFPPNDNLQAQLGGFYQDYIDNQEAINSFMGEKSIVDLKTGVEEYLENLLGVNYDYYTKNQAAIQNYMKSKNISELENAVVMHKATFGPEEMHPPNFGHE